MRTAQTLAYVAIGLMLLSLVCGSFSFYCYKHRHEFWIYYGDRERSARWEATNIDHWIGGVQILIDPRDGIPKENVEFRDCLNRKLTATFEDEIWWVTVK